MLQNCYKMTNWYYDLMTSIKFAWVSDTEQELLSLSSLTFCITSHPAERGEM